MFAYCGNNPILHQDSSGCSFSSACSMTCVDFAGRTRLDYVIYYFHPESSQNLNDPAIRNHSADESIFAIVGSFDELADAINNTPDYVNDVYIYLHSDETELVFYRGKYFDAGHIEDRFNEIDIAGNIYLFSCKGGRGNLASAMASATNCSVIASMYKVSFGNGYARCGWQNFAEEFKEYGFISWFIFSSDGNKEPYSQYRINTLVR
jgi:hypothetical protein